MRQAASVPHLYFCFRRGCFFMETDIYALSKAGFSKERIEEITRCDDKEIQIRMQTWITMTITAVPQFDTMHPSVSLGAFFNHRIFRYLPVGEIKNIIHDKTDSLFVIDQQIKMFHNCNCFLGQHPAPFLFLTRFPHSSNDHLRIIDSIGI